VKAIDALADKSERNGTAKPKFRPRKPSMIAAWAVAGTGEARTLMALTPVPVTMSSAASWSAAASWFFELNTSF